MTTRTFIPLFALAAGCAAHFPLPMTAAELAGYDSGPALVAYLGQPDASPTVCDLRAAGPHLSALSAAVEGALVDGLTDSKVPPALWRRCAESFLKSTPPEAAASLLDRVLHAYRDLVGGSDVREDPAAAGKLDVLQRLYVERKTGLEAHADVVQSLLAWLRPEVDKRELKGVAEGFGRELMETTDVEQARWQGKPVDDKLMDDLAAAGNEITLTRFADRLPQPAEREEAKRRLARIHIALSPFDEVRASAQAVEDALVKTGHNRALVAEHPVMRAWLDGMKVPNRVVWVEQDVPQHQARLVAGVPGKPGLSVLPEVQFRDLLFAQLTSVSRPVTLCAPARELDPSPCLAVSDIGVSNPLAYLDKGGAFHFVDNTHIESLVKLAKADGFDLPVTIAGKPALSFSWELKFVLPADLVFAGSGGPGTDGPNLGVRVDHRQGRRFVFSVDGPDGLDLAVLEPNDLSSFHVVSAGAQGDTGSTGMAGSDGSSGSECQSGGPGGDGGAGGPGGPGGNGGAIRIRVLCGSQPCDDALRILGHTIYSEGGAGGPGGSGGRGGAGGSGGMGRMETSHTDSDGNTVVDDPGCSPGSSGSSGMNGPDGSDGPAGAPGRVVLEGEPGA